MWFPIKCKVFFILLCTVTELFCEKATSSANTSDEPEQLEFQSTSIASDNEDSLLVLSLLDGSLVGVDHLTGKIRWTFHNEPAVIVPLNTKQSTEPVFLPDPKDGSLYMLASGHSTGRTSTLKKLPFTIQQLVASSPCRSSDGMFYTGRKIDSWFSINWKTGDTRKIQSFDELKKTCPITSTDNWFIGRTEYNILMYDSKLQNRHWNITFFDYSSQSMTAEEITNYDYVHFGGSASGRVTTYRRGSGRLLWDLDLGSPLVAVFLHTNQEMASVPFTSMEDATLDRLALTNDRDQLFPSLYVGEHRHGLYAFPTLVGQQSPALHAAPVLLIEGPNTTAGLSSTYLGHYPVPDYSSTRLQITGRSDLIILPKYQMFNGSKVRVDNVPAPSPTKIHSMLLWFEGVEHKPLYFFILLLITIVTALFFYVRAQVQALQLSQRSSQGSARDSSGSTVTALAEQLPGGKVRVGKINFDTSCVLGKGCEGTFVFKGEFETRAVAVKRLLPECFTVADREVTLLRESDTHANVVRYFCTEQDPQFRYIALELCAATLQDYVERKVYNDILSRREVLAQATGGLLHLHTLNIVHRDIKPHNVLLSMPSSSGSVRAMISDFGLCKKLQSGRTSYSRRSGITGTDGWIAPEIIQGNNSIMYHVDIFSLGCVFYYVMNGGSHPFGDTLHRQANILSNQYRLAGLNAVWRGLVECMINSDPKCRPPADVILHHPALWDNIRILSFLQDVSDRVEKEEGVEGGVLERLETGAHTVCVEGDWRAAVDPEVTADLRKYRTYRGDSVRDLLRALRNKKHHFRELSKAAQNLMGPPADSFTDYWLSRFPLLLPHSWTCLQCVRDEPLFTSYYSSKPYTFPATVSDGALPAWWHDRVQELLTSAASRHSPRQRRGSDTKPYEGNSPRSAQKNTTRAPRKVITLEPTLVENDEVEKENWMKSGEEKGVYRPRMRRRAKKEEGETNLVWTVPPS